MDSQLKSLPLSRKGCKYAKIPLALKIRLFKSVLQDGESIKRISQKLQIKYSTAKTLVRQFKDQHIKIDLKAFGNETPPLNIILQNRKICSYQIIFNQDLSYPAKEDEDMQINCPQTFDEKICNEASSKLAKLDVSAKIELICTTLWEN